jgi:hypothetical protein
MVFKRCSQLADVTRGKEDFCWTLAELLVPVKTGPQEDDCPHHAPRSVIGPTFVTEPRRC